MAEIEKLLEEGKVYSASTMLANSVDVLTPSEFNVLNRKIKNFPIKKGKCESVTSSGKRTGCHMFGGHGHN